MTDPSVLAATLREHTDAVWSLAYIVYFRFLKLREFSLEITTEHSYIQSFNDFFADPSVLAPTLRGHTDAVWSLACNTLHRG